MGEKKGLNPQTKGTSSPNLERAGAKKMWGQGSNWGRGKPGLGQPLMVHPRQKARKRCGKTRNRATKKEQGTKRRPAKKKRENLNIEKATPGKGKGN